MPELLEQFASDNYSGICPEVMEYIEKASHGYASPYGNDKWTETASNKFRELFETDCDVFFVFNGTAANSLSLASLCQSFHSIACHEMAHIETDECGAPEFASNGSKLLLVKGENGKMDPASIEEVITRRSDIHYPKPKVISLTQATEVGTVYSPEDLDKIREVAERYKLKIQVDGARFANAVASLNKTPAELTWKAGVDVLCFCGTKNGMAMGEAIIFFNRKQSKDFAYRCKQAGQLASKMRYISGPWLGLLENDVWLKNARHANDCAQYLANALRQIEGIQFKFPPQANAVFIELPDDVQEKLRAKGWHFYTFIGGCARFMCSWSSTKERLDRLINDFQEIYKSA